MGIHISRVPAGSLCSAITRSSEDGGTHLIDGSGTGGHLQKDARIITAIRLCLVAGSPFPFLPFPSEQKGVSDEDGVDEMFTGSLCAGAAEVIDELENFGKT